MKGDCLCKGITVLDITFVRLTRPRTRRKWCRRSDVHVTNQCEYVYNLYADNTNIIKLMMSQVTKQTN